MHIGNKEITFKDLVWIIICLVLIICFMIGLLMNNESAGDVLSTASTLVSIILSVVAILYTMIEGQNTAQINQATIQKLSEIDQDLRETTNKIVELKSLDKRIKDVIVPTLQVYNEVKDSGTSSFNDTIKDDIEYIKEYLDEDIDL